MTTQTPDAVREAVAKALDANVPVGQVDARTRSAIIANVLAALNCRAGDAGERDIDTGEECPVCHAVFAIWPSANKMVCHCQTYPWFPAPATPAPAVDADEVTLLRTALHEIDQIAGTTIPPDGDAAAWSALEAIIKLIHPFRTNGAYPPRTPPAVDAVPAGEGWKMVPILPTDEMLNAGGGMIPGTKVDPIAAGIVWCFMLNAAPVRATPAPAVDAVPAGEVACPTCGDTSPLEECATCGAYPTRKASLSHGEGRK